MNPLALTNHWLESISQHAKGIHMNSFQPPTACSDNELLKFPKIISFESALASHENAVLRFSIGAILIVEWTSLIPRTADDQAWQAEGLRRGCMQSRDNSPPTAIYNLIHLPYIQLATETACIWRRCSFTVKFFLQMLCRFTAALATLLLDLLAHQKIFLRKYL